MKRDQEIQDKVDHILSEIQSNKVRITPQRRAILTYLISHPTHPTAEMIYDDIKEDFSGMSLATVYNNLKTFVEFGYVHELIFENATKRYDFIDRQHAHLICKSCGKIVDFEVEQVDHLFTRAKKRTDFSLESIDVSFYGVCEECQEK
ncbi:transcriptional repressor [Facklamia sp. DSM 111018]|uniref:Transcriptional repressor n=1 Tax=Facklamia lactis TaxID=2749967 RepID=A0ABS0LRI7_9LACT|nr:Fur family transcriptional regulator [Facklamia lactis]MBG9980866.1 transcriptional repressor [Facklamia lactis]MBG9986771.1 transcriptional repressor [Facklamia lactis]